MNLHLGCWHRFIPGFVHIDLCDFEHIDIKGDISDLSMFENNSIDLIYSSHSFEYYEPKKAILVLLEWFRVLRPGGILRIAVPDFKVLMKLYQETGNIRDVLGPVYGIMNIISEGEEKLLSHKTAYDENSLCKILSDVGFSKIYRYDWRNTVHKDFDDHSQAYFPHMDKENGLLLSLNMEAVK